MKNNNNNNNNKYLFVIHLNHNSTQQYSNWLVLVTDIVSKIVYLDLLDGSKMPYKVNRHNARSVSSHHTNQVIWNGNLLQGCIQGGWLIKVIVLESKNGKFTYIATALWNKKTYIQPIRIHQGSTISVKYLSLRYVHEQPFEHFPWQRNTQLLQM